MLLMVLLLKPVSSDKSVAVTGPSCVISSAISLRITTQPVAFSSGLLAPTNDIKSAVNRQHGNSVLIRN